MQATKRALNFAKARCEVLPAERNPRPNLPKKMAASRKSLTAAAAADGGVEENAMAILDTFGIKDSRDLHDDRTHHVSLLLLPRPQYFLGLVPVPLARRCRR
jgi:hypothetical protein